MIVRIWRGQATSANADAYYRHVTTTVFPALGSIPGHQGAYLLRRDADGQVEFLGHCPDVPGLLMQHQICVLATHYEGMPLSLIEGMAAGCAVVGSRVVGVQEVIDHGRNGLLAAHADPAALADALAGLLTQPAAAARMAEAARADARRQYSLEAMTARYEALLRQWFDA